MDLNRRQRTNRSENRALSRNERFREPLPLATIKPQIDEFIEYARAHQHGTFFVTRVGCEPAGYGNE